MGRDEGSTVGFDAVQAWLRTHVHPEALLVALTSLGAEEAAGAKAYGYGRPLQVTFETHGEPQHLVLRTMAPDPFGHDRRSDRVAAMLLARDTFGHVPQHIRPHDVGVIDTDGHLVSIPPGDAFLVTDYALGTLYAGDLGRIARTRIATPLDVARAAALGRYLAALHAEHAPPEAWRRCLRDTIGSGEGIFGLCDSYPVGDPTATARRLEAIERAAVGWRWRLRGHAYRARRTHGDFHPFNLLFRDGEDFTALDCSRGGAGEPADDVTCLAVNYLFFALRGGGHFGEPFRALWDAFFSAYARGRADEELYGVVAPFFAWRCLVLASPVWYPEVSEAVRDRLLCFSERLLEGAPFRPDQVEALL